MSIPSEVDVVVAPAADAGNSYVDWPAIIAGIVVASAISILLLTFGSAVGLSFTNFHARPDVSPIWLAIAAASWLLWVQISSFMAGGYLTGRMRKRHGDGSEDESDIRDGAHGLLVWAGALIVGAALAVGGIGATANAVGSIAATATNAAATVAGGAADALDPNAYFVDMLYRPAPAGAAAAEAPAATPAPAAPAPSTTTPAAPGMTAPPPATAPSMVTAAAPASMAPPIAAPEAVRSETGRIFAQAALGELPASDRAYLAQLVSQQTGLSEDEAAARVTEVTTAMDNAKAAAADAAETARKTGVIAAFLIAASLLVSAIGAFWAAQKGGDHRDRNTFFPDVFRRF
jgi:hypothetical protein